MFTSNWKTMLLQHEQQYRKNQLDFHDWQQEGRGTGCPSWLKFMGKHCRHHFPLRLYDWQQDQVACTNTGEKSYLSWDALTNRSALLASETTPAMGTHSVGSVLKKNDRNVCCVPTCVRLPDASSKVFEARGMWANTVASVRGSQVPGEKRSLTNLSFSEELIPCLSLFCQRHWLPKVDGRSQLPLAVSRSLSRRVRQWTSLLIGFGCGWGIGFSSRSLQRRCCDGGNIQRCQS